MNSVIQLISQSKSSRLYEEKRDHVAFGKKNKCYSKGKKKKNSCGENIIKHKAK